MQRRNAWVWAALALCLVIGGTAFGQGVQTGTLVGTATSNDGSPLPGVTVTVTSPSLQGERTATTVLNGDFVVRGLPPGSYRVMFSLEGMKSVERTATITLGGTSRADAGMEVAAAEETIVVTGEAPSALETTTIGANFSKQTMDELPVGRAPATVADLAPGLTDNTPVAGQVTINGGMAYDNAILINGVNVQDPIFGQTNGLFIEEAIEETQVLTAGISAEFGGFTGGVINAITKSGGNQFTGTFRLDLNKAEWRDETPYEKDRGQERKGDLNKSYSATFGGPIVQDRLWFFLAGRESKIDTARSLAVTAIPFTTTDDSPRYEVKLTGAITPNHSVQVSYINNDRKLNNSTQLRPLELSAIYGAFEQPNDGYSVSYSGVFSNSLFGELRYSQKAFQFAGLGGTSTNIKDSPFYASGVTNGLFGVYHAPYFDATDPEDRDNEGIAGSLSYFLSSETVGSHDIKVGIDRFTVTRTGGNSQSATNYVFGSDIKANGSTPVFDAQGRLIPLFLQGISTLYLYLPERGAKLDITTDSLFVNDRWALNKNWSFNLGVRYERTTSKATGGINALDTDGIVPRLGASYDVRGDGKYKFDVTYAQYSGRYNPTIFGRNTPVGNPTGIYMYYVGPEGEGNDFAPGFNPANYVIYAVGAPTQNIKFGNLKAPISNEYTASFGMALSRGGFAKLTYVARDTSDFIDDFVTVQGGCTDIVVQGISAGCQDNIYYRNTSGPTREYESLQAQAQYRLTDNWTIAGNWTYQLKNDGNYEGEGGQSIGTSPFGNRVEMYPQNRVNPSGHLAAYQEHKGRFWTNYNLDMGRAGNLGVGLYIKYDSPTTFSYTIASQRPTAEMQAKNPGYHSTPNYTLYFGERGAGEYNSTLIADLALNYSVPVWKSLEPWVKFEIRNLLNDDTLATYNTVISADATSAKDSFGLRTGYIKGANFGKASSAASYVVPREYFISAGIRF